MNKIREFCNRMIKGPNPSITKNTLELFSIIIREQHERTAPLCKFLVQSQTDNPVHIIREKPFTKALQKGFEKGIDCEAEWTICIDADVLLSANALSICSKILQNADEKIFRINPFAIHKFHGFAFPCAIHIYQTSLLEKALSKIPDPTKSKRPETTVLREMIQLGYTYRCYPQPVALHEYQLGYSDIYRRMVLKASKGSTEEITFLLQRCLENKEDPDYQVAYLGLQKGLSNPVHEHSIDAVTNAEIAEMTNSLHVSEKSPITDFSEIPIITYETKHLNSTIQHYSQQYWDRYKTIWGNNFIE